MAFGEMAAELAKLRVEDLMREGCRLRRYRRAEPAVAPGRVGCLPGQSRA